MSLRVVYLFVDLKLRIVFVLLPFLQNIFLIFLNSDD
jgi:hypothetical protein